MVKHKQNLKTKNLPLSQTLFGGEMITQAAKSGKRYLSFIKIRTREAETAAKREQSTEEESAQVTSLMR